MASPKAAPDMEEDPMFVIKNLDTGLEMRIDDFDKLANIATEEVQVDHETTAQKKSGLTKGTKAFKHWTAATAKKATAISKKAVTGIKEAAHDLSVQSLAAKHKLPGQQPEPSPSSSRGPGSHLLASPLTDLLLVRRSAGEHPGPSAAAAELGKSGSRASLDAASDHSALAGPSSGIQLNREHTAGSSISDSTVASAAAAVGMPAGTSSSSCTAAPALIVPALSAPLTAGVPGGGSSSSSAATSAAGAAPHVAATPAASTATGAVTTPAAAAAAAAAAPGPAVPAAVRLVSHKRSMQQVQDVVLAQVLESSCGVVWVVAFSRDGSFLAAAGQDCVLRVWQLTASRDKDLRSSWVYHPQSVPRRSSGCDSSQAGDEAAAAEDHQQQHQQQQRQEQQQDSSQQLLAEQLPQLGSDTQKQQQQQQERAQPPVVEFGPYFSQQPVRQYVRHTEDILDISWSAGGFLLSASLDKSVRLWHLSQPGCLRQFWHTDFVTSVQFHPLDAQRFVSGSIDGKIRVWSITEKQQGAVLATAQLHQDMVTAVGFSLNGRRVLAGTMRGRVRFYELADRKLEYVAQVDVRNQRGQHASGKKVTGIHAVPGQPQQFLITTNDSRLRLLEGYGIMLKFKGHRNNSTQIRAGLSLDGSQVVCGSDDGWVYVWQLGAKTAAAAGSSRLAVAAQDLQHLSGKNAVYQAFQAHDAGVPVTAVAFAPPGTCDGRASVLLGHAGGGVAAGGAAGAAADGEGVPVRPGFAGRTVQSILVSGGFSGAIKVHELL